MAEERVAERQHVAGSLLRRHLSPGRLGLPRGAHGRVDVGRAGERNPGGQLAGRRIAIVEGRVGRGVHEGAADEVLKRPCLGRGGHGRAA